MRATKVAFGVLLLAFTLAGQASGADAPEARPRKKLIATGWDNPDTARLRQNLAVMEQRPFDGVVVHAVGQIDAEKRCHLAAAFAKEPWQRAWFRNCLEDLKACRSQRLTDNFLMVGANPGNVDWFDDAGWRNLVEHWRIAAWLARQGGLKGILFDPEPYTEPFAQFSYRAQPQRDQHTFAEYQAKARQRGREVMRAIAREYPNITLFTYFMNCVNSTALGQQDPNLVLEGSGYGLYPAFIDGWLDVIPPQMKLVDGCENAYLFNSDQQYLESAVMIKGACQELVSPENRRKCRAQVQVGFGIYLDAYWNPPTVLWYIQNPDGPRVERLRRNLATALRAADEYVWVYGEKFRWWPTPNAGVNEQAWPDVLPGCEAALGFARDPVEFGRAVIARMEQAGTLKDLARNGDFSSDQAPANEGAAEDWQEGAAPAGWSSWQEERSSGTFTWDRETGATGKGAARAAGVAGGCFIQSTPVQPGERYAIRAVRRLQGKGNASIRVRWQTAESRWTQEHKDVILISRAPATEWGEIFGVVEVPEGVGRLVLLLGVSGQSSAQDVAWYDDVRLYKLE